MSSKPKQIECAVPVLGVAELNRAIEFYRGLLGFAVEWGDQDSATVCGLRRDGQTLMLSEAATPGAWVWLGLENDELFTSLPQRGVKVIQPPRNYDWAYEMKVSDPDGNVLWLGCGPKADLPKYDS